jgi:hypothetical protein
MSPLPRQPVRARARFSSIHPWLCVWAFVRCKYSQNHLKLHPACLERKDDLSRLVGEQSQFAEIDDRPVAETLANQANLTGKAADFPLPHQLAVDANRDSLAAPL